MNTIQIKRNPFKCSETFRVNDIAAYVTVTWKGSDVSVESYTQLDNLSADADMLWTYSWIAWGLGMLNCVNTVTLLRYSQ